MDALVRSRRRSRWWYAFAVGVTIAGGLASRRFPEVLPSVLGKYPGDALWALMVFFGWGILFARASTLGIAGLALTTAYGIELLKLWQSSWWEEIRHSPAGHWVFGHEFNWQNFVAYAIGITCGLLIEVVLSSKKSVA